MLTLKWFLFATIIYAPNGNFDTQLYPQQFDRMDSCFEKLDEVKETMFENHPDFSYPKRNYQLYCIQSDLYNKEGEKP